MSLYQQALIFAAKKHAGQTRKNGDNFIVHPIRVSQSVTTEQQKIIALLHDTLEDTDTTYAELQENFGIAVAQTISLLTRAKEEPYANYIARLRTNPDAVQVKIADIADNLSDSPSASAIARSADAITSLLA